MHSNRYETNVEFEWDFCTHDDIDQNLNMIRLNLIFADPYLHHIDQDKYHYVSIEEVYKVRYFGENVLFDINLESAFQNLISDIHYQEMKDQEPIAMAIYGYSDI